MSSYGTEKLHLSDDEIPRIPRALIGDFRKHISPIIANDQSIKLTIRELIIEINNPLNRHDIPKDMKDVRCRIESVKGKQFPEDVAKAGFFYTGYSDTLRCFQCGRDVRDWKVTDDPWIRHAELSPKCEHIKRWKLITWKDGIPTRVPGRQRHPSSSI